MRLDAEEREGKADQKTRTGQEDESRHHRRRCRMRMHIIVRACDHRETKRPDDLADAVGKLGKADRAPGELHREDLRGVWGEIGKAAVEEQGAYGEEDQ